MRYLPDTNAWITLLRGRIPRFEANWASKLPSEIYLCLVVAYELRYGAERCIDPEHQHRVLDELLPKFRCLVFDQASARQCATLRRHLEMTGAVIGPHDLQIAAIALVHRCKLVTHNHREFSRVPGLDVEDWEAD
jgi:tRNA(fMet)-specific endonuclease VapC